MALTKVTTDVIDIPGLSVALAQDTTASGITTIFPKTVEQLTDVAVSGSTLAVNQVLAWTGTAWTNQNQASVAITTLDGGSY